MIVDQTYGEKRVQTILEQLPINEFYCYVEPRVDRKDQESRYPDFLIIWRAKGVLAVEVKDWVKLNAERCDQREVEIIKRNGEVLKKENPARTAKRYADNLMDLFEKRRELTSTYNGLEKLSFPCQGIAILPNIDGNTLSGFETSGVFPEYKVFSGDVLGNVEIFRKVLKTVRWTWDLRSPLNDEVVNIIQHTIKLTAINLHKDGDIHVIGSKIGSLNKKQEEFVYMPLPAQDAGLSVDLLRGPAGSGKTIVLAKRAELLAEVRPNLKILVTAFNLDLTDDLRKRINNPNVQVTPFFDICKKILGDQWPCIEDYRNERGPATIKGWVRNHQ